MSIHGVIYIHYQCYFDFISFSLLHCHLNLRVSWRLLHQNLYSHWYLSCYHVKVILGTIFVGGIQTYQGINFTVILISTQIKANRDYVMGWLLLATGYGTITLMSYSLFKAINSPSHFIWLYPLLYELHCMS